jgi:KDO2-lipid IV(A) lauroyltransferase
LSAPKLAWLLSRDADRRGVAFRYWVTDVFNGAYKYAAHYVLRAAPLDWGSGFGAWTGRFSPAAFPADDARARFAWKTIRPAEASPAEMDAAVSRLWRAVGRTVTEIAVLDRIWDEGRVNVVGAEHMAAVRDAGRPILAAALHLGNWEVISITGVKMGYHGASLAIPLPNRFEQRLIGKMREGFGGRMIMASPTSGRAILRELKERGPMVLYLDDFARGKVHAPAFGRPLKPEGNIAYVFRLAKLSGAQIVPVYCVRQGDACRFTVNFLPAVEVIDTGDADADLAANVARMNATIEPIVRDHLDQWFYVLDLELQRDLAEASAPRPASAARPEA